MSAVALPLPFPFRPPMGGGLVGGGVAPPITLEQVLYYLQNNIRPNAGQLFPVPPAFLGPVGAGLAFALILEGLFTSPTAREELPEPEVPEVDPGQQPVPEREAPPPQPQPGEWEYRNIDYFTLTRYQVETSLETPPLFEPKIQKGSPVLKRPTAREYSTNYTFVEQTASLLSGPGLADDARIVKVHELQETNTATGTEINDGLMPPLEAISGTTPYDNGRPATTSKRLDVYFEISAVTYVDASLYPNPGEEPGPINPQPPVQAEAGTITTSRFQVGNAAAQESTAPSTAPNRMEVPQSPPGDDVAPPAPDQATVPDSPATPIPAGPQTPVPAEARPTAPDGTIVPQQPAPVATTPADTHFPVSGQPGVNTGGTAPTIAGVAAEVGRVEKKLQNLMNRNGGADLSDWLWLLPFLAEFFQSDIPGTDYTLQGVCETVADGEDQPIATFPVADAPNIYAVVNRLDVIDAMLQQHLAWKTPTCNGKPNLEGDFRTISFRSDETSPYGKSRLRKRFRYRSTSGIGLSEIVDHWADFTFEAGSVCVIHSGSSWGTPQVWASTADEGKRVIRHAAREAGIDADQDGRWTISGSTSPRYGVSGTMRVDTTGGYYWITARDGSNARPLVAKT